MTATVTTTAPVTIAGATPAEAEAAGRRPVWRAGVVAGLAAAAATTATAAAAHAAGVSLAIAGEPIPLAGFAQLTLVGALIGTALAAVLARRSARARTLFVRTAMALTAVSLVPDVIVSAGPATRILLGFTHVVAAAIVVPALARRLAD